MNGKTVATGHLLDGVTGGLGTWGDVKTQARTMLGIELSDQDVFNVPCCAQIPMGASFPTRSPATLRSLSASAPTARPTPPTTSSFLAPPPIRST